MPRGLADGNLLVGPGTNKAPIDGRITVKDEVPRSESIFTVRRYASAVHVVRPCLSVCLSVCHKSAFYQPKDHANNAVKQPRESSFLSLNVLLKLE